MGTTGRYRRSVFAVTAILPDEIIEKLSFDCSIKTSQDLITKFIDSGWLFASRHANELISILRHIDDQEISRGVSRKRIREMTIADGVENHSDTDATVCGRFYLFCVIILLTVLRI